MPVQQKNKRNSYYSRPKSSIDQISIKKINCKHFQSANLIHVKENHQAIKPHCQSFISMFKNKLKDKSRNKIVQQQCNESNLINVSKITISKKKSKPYAYDIYSNQINGQNNTLNVKKINRSKTPTINKLLKDKEKQTIGRRSVAKFFKKKSSINKKIDVSKSRNNQSKSRDKSDKNECILPIKQKSNKIKKKDMKKSKKELGQQQIKKKKKIQKKEIYKDVNLFKKKKSKLRLDQRMYQYFLLESSQIIPSTILKSSKQQVFQFPESNPIEKQNFKQSNKMLQQSTLLSKQEIAAIKIQRYWHNYKLSKIIKKFIQSQQTYPQQMKQNSFQFQSIQEFKYNSNDQLNEEEEQCYLQGKKSLYPLNNKQSPYFEKQNQNNDSRKDYSNFQKVNKNKPMFSEIFSSSRKSQQQETQFIQKKKQNKDIILLNQLVEYVKKTQLSEEMQQILIRLIKINQKQKQEAKRSRYDVHKQKIILEKVEEEEQQIQAHNNQNKNIYVLNFNDLNIIQKRQEIIDMKLNQQLQYNIQNKNNISEKLFRKWYSNEKFKVKKHQSDITKGWIKYAYQFKNLQKDILQFYKNKNTIIKCHSQNSKLGLFYNSIFNIQRQIQFSSSTNSIRNKIFIRKEEKKQANKIEENIQIYTFDGADVITSSVVQSVDKIYKLNDYFGQKQENLSNFIINQEQHQQNYFKTQQENFLNENSIEQFILNTETQQKSIQLSVILLQTIVQQMFKQILRITKFKKCLESIFKKILLINQMYIIQYVNQIKEIINQHYKQIVQKNMKKQIGTNPFNLLKYARCYDQYQLIEDNQYAQQPAFSNQIFMIHNQKNIKKINQYTQLLNKAIFDCFNQAMDYQRPYGYWGKKLVWQNTYQKTQIPKPLQVIIYYLVVINNALNRVINWYKCRVAPLENELQEIKIHTIERMIVDQINFDKQWENIDDQLLQCKIIINQFVQNYILTQLLQQIFI